MIVDELDLTLKEISQKKQTNRISLIFIFILVSGILFFLEDYKVDDVDNYLISLISSIVVLTFIIGNWFFAQESKKLSMLREIKENKKMILEKLEKEPKNLS